MSFPQQDNPDYFNQAGPPPPKRKRWALPAALGVGGLLTGLILGAAGQPEPEIVEVPGEERVVTETTEVEVERTPEACLEALDLAEQGFSLAGQMMTVMNDALQSAGRLDASGVDSARYELEELNPELEGIAGPLNTAKAECRAGA